MLFPRIFSRMKTNNIKNVNKQTNVYKQKEISIFQSEIFENFCK